MATRPTKVPLSTVRRDRTRSAEVRSTRKAELRAVSAAKPLSRSRTPATSIFNKDEQVRLKKQALLRAAVRVFNQRGMVNTSLDHVARELNLSKGALFYYFESKQDFMYECYQSSFDVGDQALEQAYAHNGPASEKLEIYIRHYIEMGMSELQPMMILREQWVLEEEYRKKLVRRRHKHRDKVRKLIADGIAEGSIAKGNGPLLMSMFAGAISWLLMSYRADGPMSASEVADSAVRLLSDGFRARPE